MNIYICSIYIYMIDGRELVYGIVEAGWASLKFIGQPVRRTGWNTQAWVHMLLFTDGISASSGKHRLCYSDVSTE